MSLIEIDRVTKRYGRFEAVHKVDLGIDEGESVGLFGPNGAGKTSLLRMVATLSVPTDGSVYIDGEEVRGDKPEIRSRLGVVSHDSMLYDGFTARENLRLHARLHGVDPSEVRRRLKDVGLSSRGGDVVSGFSHGMRKRLSLARALLHNPEILLLDEPYAGLDQRSSETLRGILDDFTDRTVVMTTHSLEEGYNHCDRLVFLDQGRVKRDVDRSEFDSLDELESIYHSSVGIQKGGLE
ncbi:MAG: ABC transporter ATP-binding protein [Halobacteria archaeon]|nr:ABC transporter ATP-binding protein [Halobacteria archaeon]